MISLVGILKVLVGIFEVLVGKNGALVGIGNFIQKNEDWLCQMLVFSCFYAI